MNEIQNDVQHRFEMVLNKLFSFNGGGQLTQAMNSYLASPQAKESPKGGKVSMTKLVTAPNGSHQTDTIDISAAKDDKKTFDKCMKQFGVKYTIIPDHESTPPKSTIMFRARDKTAMVSAFKQYTSRTLAKDRKPTLKEASEKASEQARAAPQSEKANKRETGAR